MFAVLTPAAAPRPESSGRRSARPLRLDDAEFERIYEATARPLWGYLASMTGSGAAADDLLQETWFRFLRAGARIESHDHARNYLFRIAANLVRDEFRKRRRAPVEVEAEVEVERAAAVDGGQREVAVRSDLRGAMAELRSRDRQLLWLAHAEEFSHREIAGILGVREASVRLMLFRARQRLAAVLRERDAGPEAP